MGTNIRLIGFDADDTLWHCEREFRLTQARFAALLADHANPEHLQTRLLAAERRNLGRYGFGVKGFVLSMIETALEVTGDRVPGSVVRALIEAGHEMLAHPVELLPHARATIEALRGTYRLALITKGDLVDQERKLAASGLGELFDAVEVVAHKDAPTYRAVFERLQVAPAQALMVGNSLASDVLPVLEAGGWAVHVPSALTWALEHADAPLQEARFRRIEDLGALPGLLSRIG